MYNSVSASFVTIKLLNAALIITEINVEAMFT